MFEEVTIKICRFEKQHLNVEIEEEGSVVEFWLYDTRTGTKHFMFGISKVILLKSVTETTTYDDVLMDLIYKNIGIQSITYERCYGKVEDE